MTSTALAIPACDRAEFAQLPNHAKKQVREWLSIIGALMRAEHNLKEAIADQAARHAGKKGFSAVNIRRKWQQLNRTRDWRVLINRAKVPTKDRKLPGEFEEYWKGLCEQFQRNSRAAYRDLIRRWEAGMSINGYAAPPPAEPNGVPYGWTYGNLMRYAPTKFELVARRQGRSAAAKHRPLVFTTRKGLQVGQYYLFDDMWHDTHVNYLGVSRKSLRPLELSCLDLLSGCKVAYGMRPRLENEVTGKNDQIKEREMRFLLAVILTTIGYRPEGTTLIVEHGTAAIRPDVEQLLKDFTDGAITVDRSGREGAAAFAGTYHGRSKGNFRFKAAIESHHNLAHNELAALPGQTGKDRNHLPEELHGRDQHNAALLKAVAALPPERAELLRLPLLEWNQYQEIVAQVYRHIDNRTEHNLEGWEECGFTLPEYRLDASMPWLPMHNLLALPADKQAAVEAVISQPGLQRIRKLSPREVWDAGRTDLVRLPGWCVPALLGPQNGAVRQVGNDSLFAFEDKYLGPGKHRYESVLIRADGSREALRPGRDYLVHVNPFNRDLLYVSEAGAKEGAFLGACRRWSKVSRAEVDALARQMGRAAKRESELLTPVARRGAAITKRRIDDAKWNARVLAGEALTEAEVERERMLDAATVTREDFEAATAWESDSDEEPEYSDDEISAFLKP